MIASFRNRAIEKLWVKGDMRRVDPTHIARLTLILTALEHATQPEDLNLPGWGFHKLTGDQAGRFSIKVDKNWRLTFGWSKPEAGAINVDYEDYH